MEVIILIIFSSNIKCSQIITAGAEIVITADQAIRGGRTIELKKTVDRAVLQCPNVRQVFVSSRTGASVSTTAKDVPLEQVM